MATEDTIITVVRK